ncbi:MAG: non-hydrolyzing UDP-N-acetylglucosamine 2-epimerase [Elusimicrobiota bacterium]
MKRTENKKIIAVFGTRPEAIKMAPVVKEFKKRGQATEKPGVEIKSVVTAQHREMLDQVLDLFDIQPEFDLNIMTESQTLEEITSRCLKKLGKIFSSENPDMVLVQGDTTTTFTAALAAYYEKISVGHIEAGLRSNDRYNPFPEEINRKLTDTLSECYFAPTPGNKNNLLKENYPKKDIYVTGNTVIDALTEISEKKLTPLNKTLAEIPKSKKVILVTAHRRENWGKPLENIFSGLKKLAEKYKNILFVYPVHLNPKVKDTAEEYFNKLDNFKLVPPVSYPDMVWLLKRCYFCFTDSGGIQEEAPSLGKPVLVYRKVTERPEAVKAGTVKIIGTSGEEIYRWGKKLIENTEEYGRISKALNPYGDGKASRRIADIIENRLGIRKVRIKEWKKK